MNELLLAADGAAKEGLLWILVLLLVCFSAVHAGRLALLGWRAVKGASQGGICEKQEDKPEKTEKPEKKPSPQGDEKHGEDEKQPAPVYLLVEKKRVRKKRKYEEPKRIDLKE